MIFFDANVIVDFFVKKYNNCEENHRYRRAVKIWDSIDDTKIISNLVRIEVINILYLKLNKNKDLVNKAYNALLNEFEIIDDSQYYDEAYKKLQKFKERLSINDCIYLSVMEDFGIEKIVSFNHNFDNKGVKRIY